MQAVILVGGLGTRLRPLTERIPKAMSPVNGKPFLLYLLELLKSQGIDDIVLCTGYLGEQVKDFFGSGEDLGIRIRYSDEGEILLGTGGALKKARNLLDQYFFVINGDTYLPIDYAQAEESLVHSGKKALMIVYDNTDCTGVDSNVELSSDSTVIRYSKDKPDSGLRYVEAGVLALRRESLDIIRDENPASLEGALYPTLIYQGEMAAYIARQRFYDIGTPEQLRAFEEFLGRKLR